MSDPNNNFKFRVGEWLELSANGRFAIGATLILAVMLAIVILAGKALGFW